ncbi:hypothetical protein Q7P35_000536 [Cladosporium inversicolor]
MGCKNSDEQRYLRYREIAELVKDLRTIDAEQSPSTPITPAAASKFDFAVLDGSASKKDRKEAKRQAKAAGRVLEIRQKDIDRTGEILHPEEPVDEEFERNLLMDKSIETNMYYNPATSNSREERQIFISQDRRGKAEFKVTAAEMERIITEFKVGDMSHVKGKKERALVGRLHDKIVEDLKHDHGEARETMMRKAGFWRWASRKAYNRLAEDGRIWDWKSGEALVPVVEHEGDVVDPHGPAAAKAVAVDSEKAVDRGSLINKEDEVNDDDLLSVASLTSEASRSRPTYASSTSRDTSMSSASRTTLSSNDESADESWTTVGKPKVPKATNAFKLKLTTHGGLKRLESKVTPRTPRGPTRFAMLSIADDDKENASDGEESVLSPRTPRQRRR